MTRASSLDRNQMPMLKPGSAAYPRNQWYVIAFDREVSRVPFKRECLGYPIVLYRTERGDPVAMFDRCPHRGMPLSRGTLQGDRIKCIYHGFEYDLDGRCKLVPTTDAIPPGMRVQVYPLVKRWELLWIWMGEYSGADPALIPDHDDIGVTKPGFVAEAGAVMTIDTNYLLAHENYADAPHIPFLHSLGEPQPEYTLKVEPPRRVEIERWYEEDFAPWHTMLFGIDWTGARIRRSLDHISIAPSVAVTRAEVFNLGDSSMSIDNRQIMIFTPAGPRRTHVFGCLAQNYPDRVVGKWETFEADMREADYNILEEVQRLFDSLPPEKQHEFSVRDDEANLHFRRMIAEMLRAEQEGGELPHPESRATQAQRRMDA